MLLVSTRYFFAFFVIVAIQWVYAFQVHAKDNRIDPSFGLAKANLEEWPTEAVAYLNQLPEKRLQLDFVVMKALADADVFRMYKADYLRGHASYLATLAAEDFRIQTGFNYIDERIEPVIPQFMATATQGWNAQLGFEKLLASTGTSLKGGFTHSSQRLNFLSIPDFEYRESRFTLGIDQNLLSDFGGKGYKNLKKASLKASQANEFLVLGKIEDSILEIVSFYYNAWIKQKVLENLKESFKRRQTLNSILQRQRQNGLIESSDALQVEGLVLNNQAEVVINQQELQTIWEQLVIQLKLPESFMDVPAEQIPIGLDAPEVEAKQACTAIEFTEIQKLSSSYNQADNLIASAERKIESLRPQLLPDLRFQANFTANGINASPSETWRELRDLENPGVNLGLALNFPIQNSQAKSQMIYAQIELEQAKTNLSIIESNLKVRWRLLCKELNQKIENRARFKKINSTNTERVNLDNKRFRLGRIKAFQWVQTEDDQAASYLRLQQAEVEVRLVAWEIQKITGKMAKQINELLKVNNEQSN